MQREKRKLQKTFCNFLFALLFASATALAADIHISASLDKSRISTADQALLSVVVSGNVSNLPAPQMPTLVEFQIQNAGTSQSYSWVNGQASASVTHTFVLTPKQEGRFTIPPIRLTVEGQTLETTSLPIEVVKGDAASVPAAPSAGGQNASAAGAPIIFVTGTVDKTSPYVGEAVTYSFRLYNRAAFLRQPQYHPADTSGFWTEDLPPQRNYNASVKGASYQVVEVRTALFPTHAGKAAIGPATLNVAIQNFSTDPAASDLFNTFFNGGQVRDLRTDPITIQVKPLPTPAPAGFQGAVGDYRVSADLDKSTAKVGQPLTLTVTIAGRGNMKSLPDVPLPPLSNFRTFDANAATNIDKKDYKVQGSKVFKTVLVPTTSGVLTIPAISFIYFDPAAQSYKTVKTKPLDVHVQPAPAGSAPPSFLNNAPSAAAPGIRVLNEDIRYIKTPTGLTSRRAPLYKTKWFLGINGLAFLALLGSAGVPLYRRMVLLNPALRRFRTAKQIAKASIRDAEAAISRDERGRAGSLLTRTLHIYLAAKLGIAEGGLSLRQANDLLTTAGVSATSISNVRTLWETLDLYQFAPAQTSTEDLKRSAVALNEVIAALEKEMKWKA